MKHILTILSIAIIFAFSSCEDAVKANKTAEKKVVTNYQFTGLVKEVIQTSNYTYCYMEQGPNEYWIAVSKMAVSTGSTLYYNQGLEMRDFHSKELDRTFDAVFFIQDASANPDSGMTKTMPMQNAEPQKPQIVKDEIAVEKAAGGITIAELYADAANYEGKKVKVKGKVTKFNAAIMNKNWIHIQDGSEHDGNFDLTITTAETVNVGAVVAFEGVVALNKDFGAGYSYSLIMEEAVIIK